MPSGIKAVIARNQNKPFFATEDAEHMK